MPVYEYRAVEEGCDYCQYKFEVLQDMDEEPIRNCPRCGAPVRRLLSRPYICVVDSLSERERLVKYTAEEADRMGLVDGFAGDRIYEDGQKGEQGTGEAP